ncbi:MAG: urease accessory protein UreF [Rhodospirillaceae bacterium]
MPTETLPSPALYRLMSWLSPSFPVGAYAYSHGLEFAVEDGRVTDAAALSRWVEAVMQFGAGRNDGIFFAAAWRAVDDDSQEDFLEIAEMAAAYRGTKELALENEAQGAAFLDAVAAAWSSARFEEYAPMFKASGFPVSYPIAVALAAAASDVSLSAALSAYLHAFAANLISAGVRLIPLGQTAGQQVLAGLQYTVLDAAMIAQTHTLDDLGSAAPMVDWASVKHETQYTRLFRS